MAQAQLKICLVGCSPSSGSTYFADLLDSTPQSASGPEIGFFANPSFYGENFSDFLRKKTAVTPSPHSSSVGLYEKFLPGYGLNNEQFKMQANTSDDCLDFSEKFATRYLAFRGKKYPALLFEKTPQNIFIAKKFLKKFIDGYFIYIARNPIDVIFSLRKRGYSDYIAALTWLTAVASFFTVADNNRVKLVKYEELLDKPYSIVSDTLAEIARINVSPEEIERYYINNTYRAVCETRLSSWSTQSVGEIKPRKPIRLNEADKGFFKFLIDCKLTKSYSEIWGVSQISFGDALSKLDYKEEYYDAIEGKKKQFDKYSFKPKYKEKKLMMGKWIRFKVWKKNPLSIKSVMLPLYHDSL